MDSVREQGGVKGQTMNGRVNAAERTAAAGADADGEVRDGKAEQRNKG